MRYIDGPSQSEFEGYGDAVVEGKDSVTFVAQDVVSDPENIVYTATVVGATDDDDGVVAVVNEFNGQVVDCDYIVKKRKRFFKKRGDWRCFYKIDPEIKEICKSAASELSVDAFVKGSGALVVDTFSVQELPEGFATSAIDLGEISLLYVIVC